MRNYKTNRRFTKIGAGILALGVTLSLAACGDSRGADVESDPGITDDTVVIGASVPRSGPASAYAVISDSLQVYLKMVNDAGGVEMADGKTRKIEYVSYDDAYTPDGAVTNVRRLVNEDEALAIVGIVGTPPNIAVRDYLNENEVPQLFADSPSSMWGDVENYPWTRGMQPTFGSEAAVYASYVIQEMPDATVAILSQNDDYGSEFVAGFTEAIQGSDVEIIAHETYEVTDPTVAPQVAQLYESGATVFLNISTTKAAAQSISRFGELGWDAMHLINRLSASVTSVFEPAGIDNANGILSAGIFKDAGSTQWADDPAITEFKELVSAAGVNPEDPFAVHGRVMGQLLVDALERMEEPTRAALMDAVDSYDNYEGNLMLPGVTAQTSEGDPFIFESMYLQQFDGEQWVQIGDLISFEGQSTVYSK